MIKLLKKFFYKEKKKEKTYSCVCEMISDGKAMSGYCHKHHTDWV